MKTLLSKAMMLNMALLLAVGGILLNSCKKAQTADSTKREQETQTTEPQNLDSMIYKEVIYKNLAVYPIKGESRITREYVTLKEAMEKGLTVLHETGDVGELVIDNMSESYIFIMAGDIVKGGRQDRTMGADVILKPGSKGVPLQSFCVEHSRWHQRGYEDARRFSSSEKMLSSSELKRASRVNKRQSEVWEEVDRYQRRASTSMGNDVRSRESASSLELTLDNEQLKSAVKEYLDAIKPAFANNPNITGFAYSINGRLTMVEDFGSPVLFGKLRDKLLESAASEAVSKLDRHVDKYNNPTSEEVQKFLLEAQSGRDTTTKINEITVEKRYETPSGILFMTYHDESGISENVHTTVYNTDRTNRTSGNGNGDSMRYRYGGFQRDSF